MRFAGLHHVQLAMPPGREDDARAFYTGVLGLEEIAKPASLADRGGCWFRLGSQELHLGVEAAFAPARKAHPAVVVDDLRGLRSAVLGAGLEVIEDDGLPGYRRFYVNDPFGNRLEFLQVT